jgi:hypothetical protein
VSVVVVFPSKRKGLVPSFEVECRSSLMSSRKLQTCRFRRSEGGRASETLRCLTDAGPETDVEVGGKVVTEFKVEGKGADVDVDVVIARVRIVADVDTFEDEDGAANGLEKEKVEEEDGIVQSGDQLGSKCRVVGTDSSALTWRSGGYLGK